MRTSGTGRHVLSLALATARRIRQTSSVHSFAFAAPRSDAPVVVRGVAELRAAIAKAQASQGAHGVGLVPTMGSLHQGHLSLAARACADNDVTVASVFVNPTQFGEGEDFDAYPRDVETDTALLAKEGVDIVWAPGAADMYPGGFGPDRGTFVETLGVSGGLEGSSRPHFFRGVCTVVSKLLNAVSPTTMYLGQKDAQQCAVLRRMVRELLLPVHVEVCPTVREADGLAMSSRNRYLGAEERAVAPCLYAALREGEAAAAGGASAGEVREVMRARLDAEGGALVRVDYLSVADAGDLVEVPDEAAEAGPDGWLLSGAMWVGRPGGVVTRLIDNILLPPASAPAEASSPVCP